MAEGALKAGYVVDVDDVEAQREADDTAATQVTIDASKGCDRLTQRVLRFAPGRSSPRAPEARLQEILYVVSGAGTLYLNGEHPLEADTGAYVLPEDTYEIDNPGPESSSSSPCSRRSSGGRKGGARTGR